MLAHLTYLISTVPRIISIPGVSGARLSALCHRRNYAWIEWTVPSWLAPSVAQKKIQYKKSVCQLKWHQSLGISDHELALVLSVIWKYAEYTIRHSTNGSCIICQMASTRNWLALVLLSSTLIMGWHKRSQQTRAEHSGSGWA
jgi:hypothetical protein